MRRILALGCAALAIGILLGACHDDGTGPGSPVKLPGGCETKALRWDCERGECGFEGRCPDHCDPQEPAPNLCPGVCFGVVDVSCGCDGSPCIVLDGDGINLEAHTSWPRP